MPSRYFREEHDIFRKSVRDYVEKELLPHAEEWEGKQDFPKSVFSRMGELGLLGARYPVEVGGSGGDYWFEVVLYEELARSRMLGMCMSLMVQTSMATPIIGKIGSAWQKEEFLKPALEGKKIAALGITEPGAGSDVAGILTTAKKDGDSYVINGSKTFITNGTRADFITLAAKTAPELKHKGMSLFTFPTSTKGFSVSRKLEKLGNHTSDTAELAFEDCRVPAKCLLGEENKGFQYIMRNFNDERLTASAWIVAITQMIFDDALAYSLERKAFGKPIGKFQVTRHRFADMAMEIEAARQLVYATCSRFVAGEDVSKEVAMCKLFSAEMAQRVATGCLQVFGGYGYMEEYFISRAFRDLRLFNIGGGTSEIMREIIAKQAGI